MADKSIGINLKDTFESVVLNGLINPNTSFWTGVIDSKDVDDMLVDDDRKRMELKNAIIELENVVKKIRSNKVPQLDNAFDHVKVQEYTNFIFSIIIKHVDLELYLIYLIKKYDLIKSTNPDEFRKINGACKKQMEQNRQIILKENAVFAYPIYIPERKEYSFRAELIKDQESQVKKKGNEERLIRFLRIIYKDGNLDEEHEVELLDQVCEKIVIPDFVESSISPALRSLIYQTVLKNYLIKRGTPREEIDQMSFEELKNATSNMYLYDEMEYYKQALTDTLLTNIEYMSIDKFILAFLERTIEDYNRSAQLSFNFQEIFQESRELQDLIKRVVDSKIVSGTASIVIITNDGDVLVNLKSIRAIQKEFIDGIYLTPDIINSMREILFLGNSNLDECSQDVIRKLNYSSLDWEVISLVDFSNLKRLYEVERIDKNFINRLVRNCSLDVYTSLQEKDNDDLFNRVEFPTKMDLIIYLFNNSLIDAKDIYEYYMQGQISLEDIKILEESLEDSINFNEQISNEVTDSNFFNLYREYIESRLEYEQALKENDSDIDTYKMRMEMKRQQKEKILVLYQKYRLDNLSLEDRNKFIEDILFYYCVENEEDIVIATLREMYKDGVVCLENIEHLDTSYLQSIVMDTMFARGELNLEDTEKIRSGLSADALKNLIINILRNPEITRSQKFTLIMNVYNSGTKEDIDIANELLEQLKLTYDGNSTLSTEKTAKVKKPKTTVTKTGEGKSNDNIEWVYPRYIKWEFLKALDKEAEIKLYAGGYVEVYSRKLNVRIIERYFESDKTGDDFGIDAYGYATYILKEDTYRRNLDQLVSQKVCRVKLGNSEKMVLEDVLNRDVLTDIVPREDRIRHNTQSTSKNWMREMARYFEIDLETEIGLVNDSRYSQEELQQLRDVIKMYENAYVDRNTER